MSKQKVSPPERPFSRAGIPSGTRDFSPEQVAKRNFIFSTIKSVFEKYGYQPIETPAMENLSTLTGKYGEEGDKLLFRILNSGPVLDEVRSKKSEVSISDLTEKGLRYDLTVPFARYVVQHQNEITFPFKRYQIQPVWRADRPQKGRYREFWQCDADVIGSDSLLNEVELIQIQNEVFRALNVIYVIFLNHRKILQGLSEYFGVQKKFMEFVTILDKLYKMGEQKVFEELKILGADNQKLNHFFKILNKDEKELEKILMSNPNSNDGLHEVKIILNHLASLGLSELIKFEVTLARGLNYYTSAIFETSTIDYGIGTIAGGGRYDNLTGFFGLEGVSGVGFSFGVERIFDSMEALKLFPEDISTFTKVLFVNFGGEEEKFALQMIKKVRDAGINSEMYPDAAKLKKQFDYANKKGIPFVAVIGEEERKKGAITLKDMSTSAQESLTIEQIIERLKNGK